MLGLSYNTKEALATAADISRVMRDAAYEASIDLAKEKGSFPLLNTDKYLDEGTFASRLPDDIKDKIYKYGIRNSHLLSIAPTGTVSLAFADNASNGIEPPFSLVYMRKKRLQHGGHKEYVVMDHGLKVFLNTLKDKDFANTLLDAIINKKESFTYNSTIYDTKLILRQNNFITALEMTADEHLAMMAVVQPYIDSSISKTVNVPADYPFESFKEIYNKAHKLGLKGVATYRPNNIIGSVLSEIPVNSNQPEVTPMVKEKMASEPTAADHYNTFMYTDHIKRPEGTLSGCSSQFKYYNTEGDVKFYVGMSFLETEIALPNDLKVSVRRPIELFINSEMNVGNEWSKLLGITLSQMARISIDKLAKYLKTCIKMRSDRGSIRFGYVHKLNGGKAPRYHGSDIAVMAYAIQELLINQGLLDQHGDPMSWEDTLKSVSTQENIEETTSAEENESPVMVATGAICTECGSPSVIKKDGCKFCTNCGAEGSCG